MSIIKVTGLSKTFGSGHTAVPALSNINLTLAAGEVVLIIGPSGSGKTTLLSMIGALLTPTEGAITFNGVNLAEMSEAKLAETRLHRIGFIFQSFNLLGALTAEQNVTIPLLAAGMPHAQARNRTQGLLKSVGLEKRSRHLPQNLSGGEKQRVAIARALANEPALILADEPTANLDSQHGGEVMDLLCQTACSDGRTVVVVSHDPRLRDIANRVLTIEDGRLVKEEAGNHDDYCPRDHR